MKKILFGDITNLAYAVQCNHVSHKRVTFVYILLTDYEERHGSSTPKCKLDYKIRIRFGFWVHKMCLSITIVNAKMIFMLRIR